MPSATNGIAIIGIAIGIAIPIIIVLGAAAILLYRAWRRGCVNHPRDDALEMVIPAPEPIGFNPSPDSSFVSDVDIEPTGFNPSPDSSVVSTVDNTTVKQECDSTAEEEEEEDNDEEVIYTSPVAHRTRSRRNNN